MNNTSLTADADGNKVLEIRYKAWGEIRATWTSSPSTTPAYKMPLYQYTGQASYMDDPTTSGVTEGFGLMFYQSRFYDPQLGRFTQADTIIPGGVQGLDRYAYVSNNPIKLSDPSGHKCVGDAAECLNDGKKGAGFTGGDTKPALGNGCGGIGQKRCDGGNPAYGDGLIGPPPTYGPPAPPTPPVTGLTGGGIKPIGWSGTYYIVGVGISIDIVWINPNHEIAVNLNITGMVGPGLGTSVDLFHPEAIFNAEHASDLTGPSIGMQVTFVPELGASVSGSEGITSNPATTPPAVWEVGLNAGAEVSFAYTGSYTIGLVSFSFDDFSGHVLVGTPWQRDY